MTTHMITVVEKPERISDRPRTRSVALEPSLFCAMLLACCVMCMVRHAGAHRAGSFHTAASATAEADAADATDTAVLFQKVEVKWQRVETSGGMALPNTLPPALRRTLSYVFETPSPVHNYRADLANHVLQFCLRVTYAPGTGSQQECQQQTTEYIRLEYPPSRVKASRGPLKLANNLAVNLSLTLADRVGPWAIGFKRNDSQSPRYSASALLAGVARMGANKARKTCEHHGLPIDGVFCAAINRALRDEWRRYGIVRMLRACAVKGGTDCTLETRLHWLNTRRLLHSAAWDGMFQHAIAHERAQAHKLVRREGSCAAGLNDKTNASSPPALTSSPYNELPLEQCGDDRTSCSACGRCFRANEYVIDKDKKYYVHEEEFVTVPADVQVGGKFEHTFASGERWQLTVPVGAGPGYRLKVPELLRGFEMWGGTFFAGATKPDDGGGTTTHERERLLVRAEHCRRKVLPVMFRLPVADRWMLFVDGRDHHRGDLAYERELTRAKWHTRLHGNELPGWTDELDSSYLGYWHIAYERIALTCAVPLSAELVVQFLVWLVRACCCFKERRDVLH